MDSQKSGTLGAAFVLLQGLVTALFPQISIKFIKQMVGKNFDNASELEAKPPPPGSRRDRRRTGPDRRPC